MIYAVVSEPNGDIRAEYETEAEALAAIAQHIDEHPEDTGHYVVEMES